jgi:hypothetical protein
MVILSSLPERLRAPYSRQFIGASRGRAVALLTIVERPQHLSAPFPRVHILLEVKVAVDTVVHVKKNINSNSVFLMRELEIMDQKQRLLKKTNRKQNKMSIKSVDDVA